MKPKYTRLRGVRDILPEELIHWRDVELKAREIFRRYNYKEIETPIIEPAEIFIRTVGEETDIVRKEMYIFKDRGDRLVALRPEGTAPVVRAFLENKLYTPGKVSKFYYIGDMFRYDRPQAGRQREFHQIGIEALGEASYILDVEVISLLLSFLNELGLKNITLLLNSVGCPNCRTVYSSALREFFASRVEMLCEDCKERLGRNPLRILDCKVDTCRDIAGDAPSIMDYLCEDCKEHFDKVKEALTSAGIPYILDNRLVRGLDYYTKTAFEVKAEGFDFSIGGGGRYDGLVKELGGPDIPGIGFAIGMERLLEVLEGSGLLLSKMEVPDYFIAYEPDLVRDAIIFAERLRSRGFTVEISYTSKALKSQLREADRSKSRKAVIIKNELWINNRVILKDMTTGEQQEVESIKLEVCKFE
ncbi:TPA: histidine--tRNA ligase [bacterium]|jgi:histidyl-tRNA synthetase|nr:histidine--tRNA ligase [bacterium]HOK29422.1 histidine--tRNA ligase [bacterium]HPO81924.1 histidine--tRNA ligase [bacterium]